MEVFYVFIICIKHIEFTSAIAIRKSLLRSFWSGRSLLVIGMKVDL